MALENEYMLEELTAEEIYQKKLTAGTNITIDNQNVISATGGGSSVQYTSNYAQGDILGTLNIDGASSAIRTPNLVEGENITITRNQQAGTVTISSTGGGAGDLSAHELTEEAYNALTPAEKTNGELYLTHPATVSSSDPNKIYYNNTLYGTEGGNDVVELTQAEWDALPSSKLTDDIIYVITDGGDGGGASAVSELTDVELTNLADGEILKYDATEQKWLNAVESGGGGGAGGSSVYSEKQLYKASVDSFQNISVTWDWEEYDAYIFNVHDTCLTTSDKQNGESTILTKAQIKNLIDTELKQCFYRGNGYTVYVFSDSTITANENSRGFFITEIIGLKFGTLSPIIYSEEEREVGVWLDNKPLYQKSWSLTNPVTVASNTFTALTTIGTEVKPIRFECMEGDYTAWQTTSVYNNTANGTLDVLNIRNRSITIKWFTLWYTKTTDTAGSGSYNTLGVPTVHYDTTEQVIGTFLGKTLYQKIFDWSSSPVNIPSTWSVTTIDSSNIERVIECKGHHSDGTFYTTDADPTGNSHTKLKMRNNGGGGTYSYVTLQYTKIND